MELGGNQKAREFLKKNSKDSFGDYNNPLAKQYKADLEIRVSNRMGDRNPTQVEYKYSDKNIVNNTNTPPTK